MQLNYHHLRYFREVASVGNLTRAAARLNLSQSALSIQIKQLEQRLGHALFDRTGRTLTLTEAGRIALDHADRIFDTGDDLLLTLAQRGGAIPPIRIGALSTLSRNFQIRFLEPLIAGRNERFVLRSGDLETLFAELAALSLDVILTTEPPENADWQRFSARLVDRQPINLIGKSALMQYRTLSELLEQGRLIVPTDNAIRTGLASRAAELRVKPNIVADVDDMAMVRLLARAGAGIAVVPSVVLADEVATGLVVESHFDLGQSEDFYAVTVERQFPHPALGALLDGYVSS